MTSEEAARRRQLNRLTRIWGTIDQQALTEYVKATTDLTTTELEAAVDEMIRTRRIRPTPRDIRDAIHPPPPPAAVPESTHTDTRPQNMGRHITEFPDNQKPDPDGIRPFIHDAVRRYANTGIAAFLENAAQEPSITETEHDYLEAQRTATKP